MAVTPLCSAVMEGMSQKKVCHHVEVTPVFAVTVEVMDVVLAIFLLVRHKFQVLLKLTEERIA